MANKMEIKFDKYWGECNLLLSIANVLDPRCKLKMVKFSFDVIYGKDDSSAFLTLVRSSMQALYNNYNQLQSSSRRRGENSSTVDSTSTSTHQPGSSSKTSSGNDFMLSAWGRFDEYLESRGNDESEIVKSDLDIYLEEGVHRCKDASSANFDYLEWWKVNVLKYLILSRMARDILTIPITTVVSEATFSVSGRILDMYHSSLLPKTVQALVCAGDWLRRCHGVKHVEDDN